MIVSESWRRAFLRLLGAIALAMVPVGCRTARPIGEASSAQTQAANDVTYDPLRAFLSLDEIAPDPPAPRTPADGVANLSAQGARRLKRARGLYEEGRFTESAIELEKALRQEPEHPLLHRELALALRAAGEHQRVRSHLKTAVEGDSDDSVSHYLLGLLAFEDGQWERAIRYYRTALKASNAEAEPAYAALCRFHLAKALNAEGYLTAAIEQYRAYEAAVAALQEEARSNRDLAALLAINEGRAGKPISVAYEKLGRYEEAAEALAEAYRDREPDPGTREHLARLLARTGRYEEALEHARLLVQDSDRALELLAELHEAAGTPERVVDDFRSLYAENPERSEVLRAYADALVRFDRIDEAKGLLQEAVNREAVGKETYWRLFDLCEQTGAWGEALATAAAAVERFPEAFDTAKAKVVALADDAEAMQALLGDGESRPPDDRGAASAALLGALARNAEGTEQARRLLENAIREEPGFKPARVELAGILLDEFEWQAVIDLVTSDEEALRDDNRLQRLCGRAYAGLDEFEHAAEHLNAALALNPSDVGAMVALAGVYSEAGQVHRAASQYKRILELNPLHEAAREELIKYYVGAEPARTEEAREHLAELQRLNASPHRIARCKALIERGEVSRDTDWEAYREVLTRATAEHGPDAATYARIAESYIAEGRFQEAVAPMEQALALDPYDDDVIDASLVALQRTLQYERLVRYVRELLDRHPNRVKWIVALWQALTEDHRFEEAYAVAKARLGDPRLSEEERDRFRGFCFLALSRGQQWTELIDLVRAWHEAEPEDPQLALWLVIAFGAADRHDEAIEVAYAWYNDDPNAENRFGTLQTALRQANRLDRAMQLVLERLERDQSDPALQEEMVDLLMLAKRPDEALELLDHLDVQSENSVFWRLKRLEVLQHDQRFEEAGEVLSLWIQQIRSQAQMSNTRFEAQLAELQFRLATNKLQRGDLEEAAADLTRWKEETRHDPIRIAYLQRLSVCYTYQGDVDRAIEALREAHELNPRAEGLNNDLGYSLSDAGRDLDEAERMIRYAVGLDPDNGAYLDSLGWVLYKKGRFEAAREWLEKAETIIAYERALGAGVPSDAVIYGHLGDVYWKLDLSEEAVESWRRAAELLKDAPDLEINVQMRDALDGVNGKLKAVQEGREPETAAVVGAAEEPEPAR